MEKEYKRVIEKAREILFKDGFQNISVARLASEASVDPETLGKMFPSVPVFIDKMLEDERESFESIFKEYNFEGMNAVDILLIVSREVHDRFYHVNPSITLQLRQFFPDIYKKHIEEKLEFMYMKIKINIEKGIAQGMYRQELEADSTAREFINWFYEVHQPEHSPKGGYSFGMIFEELFEKFVDHVANPVGAEYYKSRKQLFDILSFGH